MKILIDICKYACIAGVVAFASPGIMSSAQAQIDIDSLLSGDDASMPAPQCGGAGQPKCCGWGGGAPSAKGGVDCAGLKLCSDECKEKIRAACADSPRVNQDKKGNKCTSVDVGYGTGGEARGIKCDKIDDLACEEEIE